MQAEVGRIFEAVRQLQIDDKTFSDKILELEENKKSVDTQLGIISKDLARESASGKSLRQVIEQKINEDIRIALKDTASTKIQVENLRQELAARIRPNPPARPNLAEPARPNPAELGNGTAARIRPNSDMDDRPSPAELTHGPNIKQITS